MKWKFRKGIDVDLSCDLHIQTILRGPLVHFGIVLKPWFTEIEDNHIGGLQNESLEMALQ